MIRPDADLTGQHLLVIPLVFFFCCAVVDTFFQWFETLGFIVVLLLRISHQICQFVQIMSSGVGIRREG